MAPALPDPAISGLLASAFCDWCARQRGVSPLAVMDALSDLQPEHRASIGNPIGWGALDRIVADTLGTPSGAIRFPTLH